MINGKWSSEKSTWTRCKTGSTTCTSQWAVESIGYACSTAYKTPSGSWVADNDALTTSYYNAAYPLIEERLAQAGVRLATLVNSVADGLHGLGTKMW
jgi:hypothetical protein